LTNTIIYPRSCNHKRISIYYLLTTILYGLSGSFTSVLIRIEWISTSIKYINKSNWNCYNLNITLHGLLMIFFLIVPNLYSSYGNMLVWINLWIIDVSIPRINNISIIVIPIAFILIYMSIESELGIGVGWTLYPTLSTTIINISTKWIILTINGLLTSGISTNLTSVVLYVTLVIILITLQYIRLHLYLISLLTTASLLIIVLPIITASLIMLLTDLYFNTIFYDNTIGGDPLLYQHLFWYFAHPEVYILILPAFGLLTCILSITVIWILVGNTSIILAISGISIIGSLVWSHHMFLTNLEVDSKAYFTSITFIISIPTGNKLYNWLITNLQTIIYKQCIKTIIYLQIQVNKIMILIGGSTGIILSNNVIDIVLHDTYYVITHFHLILSLGTVITLIISFLSFIDIYLSLSLESNNLSLQTNLNIKYFNWLITYGIILTFIPMHLLGFNIQIRRLLDFHWYLNTWNYLISIGSNITLISLIVYTL